MNLTPIPADVAKLANKIHAKAYIGAKPLTIPAQAIEGVTTGGGTVIKGVRVWIIDAQEREVFLGKACERQVIPEFLCLMDSGCIAHMQYGRDFIFTQA